MFKKEILAYTISNDSCNYTNFVNFWIATHIKYMFWYLFINQMLFSLEIRRKKFEN